MADNKGVSGCCGSCYWYLPDDETLEWGDCGANPPSAMGMDDGTIIGIWPSVEAAHHHCGKYVKTHNEN